MLFGTKNWIPSDSESGCHDGRLSIERFVRNETQESKDVVLNLIPRLQRSPESASNEG